MPGRGHGTRRRDATETREGCAHATVSIVLVHDMQQSDLSESIPDSEGEEEEIIKCEPSGCLLS